MKKSILIAGLFLLFSCNKKGNSVLPAGTLQDGYANQYAGFSCIDLLANANFNAIGIEIDYMTGYKPDTAVVINTVDFLNAVCNKPGGISIREREIPANNGSTMNINDIMYTEATNRTSFNGDKTIWICVLITDGKYADSSVLGLAYRNTSICLLGKNIYDNSGGLGQVNRVTLESTIMEHEMGHLLGLVNMAPKLAPMVVNHLDQVHDHHCTNSNCLMYYQVETTDLLGILLGGAVPQLDSNCLNDLHANGGK